MLEWTRGDAKLMSLDECFDIFDENMVWIGTASRREAHARGLWHQTFHCWILRRGQESDWEILLQLRHREKETFPGLLDVSCAGHLLHGEKVEDGVRELEEELGIAADYGELDYAGISPDESYLSDGRIDREFSHIHLYTCALELDAYKLQADEVSGLLAVPIEELDALVRGKQDLAAAHGVVYDDAGISCRHIEREISLEDLTPNSQSYYDKLFAGIRHLTGGRPS